MFGLSSYELLVVVAIALVVLGPRKLPEMARHLGKFYGLIRRTTNELKYTLDQELRDEDRSKRRDAAEQRREEFRRKRLDKAEPLPDVQPAPQVEPEAIAEPRPAAAGDAVEAKPEPAPAADVSPPTASDEATTDGAGS